MTTSDNESLDQDAVQSALQELGMDGWLFYYFQGNDPLALRILRLGEDQLFSRRWFYLIPKKGTPIKLVHRIEAGALDSLPGEKVVYLGWRELESKLKDVLASVRSVAMQYSPSNAIPYVSRVDAGTVELVKEQGVEVVSSADLVQMFESRWSERQLATHIEAADWLRKIVFASFDHVSRSVANGQRLTEYELQQFIMGLFDKHGLSTNHPPIVAVNANSGNPHYLPGPSAYLAIRENDFLLLDIWAKLRQPPDAVYADITWTGYVGEDVPDKYVKIFDIVRGARDAALRLVSDSVRSDRKIFGWQVDDKARQYIRERGYGEYFLHRTGHSIGLEVHANGANIDNLETRDERRLIARTAFSIEPGIYLPEFGIRSEINVYIGDRDVVVAGQPMQTEIVPIMALRELEV